MILDRPYTAGDPGAQVRGFEAVFEFNGVRFNDRIGPDRYVLTDIGGLDDADIRDTREVNPSDDGETAYDSFYGGRTITFTGYINAGNLDSLRMMQDKLRRALSRLTEAPLNIRYYGHYDTFSYNSLPEYTVFAGSGNLAIAGGVLSPTNSSVAGIYYGIRRPCIDVRGSVMMAVAPSGTWTENKIVTKLIDQHNYLFMDLTPSKLIIGKCDNSVESSLVEVSLTEIFSSPDYVYTYFDVVGNDLKAWFTKGGDTIESASYTLVGADATKYGNGVSGWNGLKIKASSTNFSWDNLEFVPLNPCDVYLYCRKSASLAMHEQWVNHSLRRDFMVTLRASRPVFLSTVENGRFDDLTSLFVTSTDSIIILNNAGNYRSKPTIVLHGLLKAPIITNGVTGKSITFKSTTKIVSGDYWEIDIANKTIVDSYGNNKFNELSTTSDWLELEPGENPLTLSVSEFGVKSTLATYPSPTLYPGSTVSYPTDPIAPKMVVFYRHTWI